MSSHFDYIEKARGILSAHGLMVDAVDCSGELVTCGTAQKPHGTDGRYKLHMDFPPTLWLCNYHEGGEGQTFPLYESGTLDAMTEAEKAELRERIRREKKEAQEKREKARQEAAREAKRRIATLPLAGEDNAYLKRKGVLPLGDMRQEKDGRLVLPLLNAEGETVSLQFIGADSEKRFLPGGEKKGCFFPVPAKDGGKSGPLLIGEGTATVLSCCMATGYAGLVAFDAGNLLPVAEMARQKYPGREIILCADNDCTDKDGKPRPEEKNTGVLCARKAAEAIGAKLAICPAIRGHKADFNDLFTDTEDGPERVRVCIEKAIEGEAVSEWEEPIRFGDYDLPKLDINKLPKVLADFCSGVTEFCQVPLELTVAQALPTLAVAAQSVFKVEVKEGYDEPLNVYTLCPLEPGNRKSSVSNLCSKPLREWEKEQQEAMEKQRREVASKRKTLEQMIEGVRRKAVKCKSWAEVEPLQREISELEAELPELPVMPRLLTDNITPEALAVLMAEQGECIAIITAEPGIFDILAGMYSKGVPNLDLFLKAHSAEGFCVDRRGSNPVILAQPRLTLGIASQEVALTGRSSGSTFRDRGVDGRFLYFIPESRLGYRDSDPAPLDPAIRERFYNKLRSLLAMSKNGEPFKVKLSPEAYRLWNDFFKEVEVTLRPDGELKWMKDWGGKLAGAVARIAGLFHVAEHDQPQYQPISLQTMEQAVYMGAFLTEHAKAAYELMGSNEDLENAKAVLGWIQRKGADRFKANDCWQGMKGGRFTEAAIIKKALNILEDRGFIRKLPIIPGKKPSPTYLVNPATLKG